MQLLVLGTRNRKKRVELSTLLEPLGFELRTLDDYEAAIDVEETGTTFAENATKKAVEQARVLNTWVLGEDSGLSVVALNNAPGVYSARFAGQQGNDEANNQKLLEALVDVPWEQRDAFYTCHMAVANAQGEVLAHSEDYCHGRIRFRASGTGGFGYDPLFEVREYHRTFGELGGIVKSVLSHRARAIRRLVPQLRRLID